MPTPDTFHCSVITPERKMIECEATFVAFPAHDGQMGVLRNRAPLICKLGIGTLRIRSAAETHRFFVNEGFAQVVENRLTILTEQARKAESLNVADAEAALEQAKAMKITDDSSYVARDKAIRRARIQLDLARSAD